MISLYFLINLVAFTFVQLTKADVGIVGGSNARLGEFPYQVSLQMNKAHMCGGSIISPTHIVTAAHCIPSQSQWSSMSVVTGMTNLSQVGQRSLIKNIIIHEGYNTNPRIIDYDIAMVVLAAPIPFNSLQSPIRLASRDYAIGGTSAVLSGWGKTSTNGGIPNTLQKLSVRIISRSDCQAVHGNAITLNQLCTYVGHDQGACQGDSGGPLAVDGEVVGLVSWGIPCAKGYPDVFTNVYTYRSWIQRALATN